MPASVPKTTSSVPQISVAHDIIAIKNAAGLVAAQFHGHPLRNARSEHVADGGPPEVVRDAARTAGGRPSSPPRLVETAFRDSLTCPVPRKAGPGDGPVEEYVLHDRTPDDATQAVIGETTCHPAETSNGLRVSAGTNRRRIVEARQGRAPIYFASNCLPRKSGGSTF